MGNLKIKTQITDSGQDVEFTAPLESIEYDGKMIVGFLAYVGQDDDGNDVYIPYVATNDREPRTRSLVNNICSGASVAGRTGYSSYKSATAADTIKKGSKAIRRAAISGAKRGFLWGVATQVAIELVMQAYDKSKQNIPTYYLSLDGPDLDAPVYVS